MMMLYFMATQDVGQDSSKRMKTRDVAGPSRGNKALKIFNESISVSESDISVSDNRVSDYSCSDEDVMQESSSDESEWDDNPEPILPLESRCMWGNVINNPTQNFPIFESNSKVLITPDNTITPVDLYLKMINDEVWEMMVRETNRFAYQYRISTVEKQAARTLKWKDTYIDEMKKFVGIIICMGLSSKPKINLYWSKNDLYEVNLIKKTMPRDRFLLLLKFFHFSNNYSPEALNDRLHKIRELVDRLNENFARVLKPGRDLVVESMIPWRGRLLYKQYIPNKAHKHDVKLYKLCTKEGFTVKTIVYIGKATTHGNRAHSHEIVMELLTGFLDEGRRLFVDNFFTSIPLAEELLKRKTEICGKLRKNRRGVPKEIINWTVRKSEVIGKECNHGIKIVNWVDKRSILMLSSVAEHSTDLIDTGRKPRMGSIVKKPQCILDYNAAKKGVNFGDQMASYYSCLRKTLKWYRKVAIEQITGTSVVNAWIIYCMQVGKQVELIEFTEAVARGLMDQDESNANVSLVGKRRCHTFRKKEGASKSVRKRCSICYKENRMTMTSREADGKTKQVVTYCEDCPNSPFMCLTCFNKLHKF